MGPHTRDYIDPTQIANIWSPSIPPITALPQINHRLALLSHWSPTAISPHSRVLEIGCGQGDMTACLAAAVGPSGRVVAIDPADPSYGSPLTLGQAQGKLSASDVGKQGGVVKFLRADAVGFAAGHAAGERFDAVVLAKSLWYFESRAAVLETLRAAARVGRRVCVAEYALASVDSRGQAHVLAAVAQGALYAAWQQMGWDEAGFLGGSNLRVLLGSEGVKVLAEEAGLRLVSEGIVRSSEDGDLQDGGWDSSMVVTDEGFLNRVEMMEEKTVGEHAWSTVVRSVRDAAVQEVLKLVPDQGEKTLAQRLSIGLKRVRTMDVWVAEFEVVE